MALCAEKKSLQKNRVILLMLVLALAGMIIAGIAVGAVAIPPGEICVILLKRVPAVGNLVGAGTAQVHDTIIMTVRLPRVVLAALVGSALAAAGVSLQALFRNPLADPYLIGASAGAALGGCLAILFRPASIAGSAFFLPAFAFIGSLGAVLVVFGLARSGKRVAVGTLLLAGIAVGSFLSAIVSMLIFSSSDRLRQLVYWLMGSLSARDWGHVTMVAPYIAVALFVLLLFTRELNALLLGDESAQYLGVDVEKAKRILLAAAALLTAASVAAAGPIGFVGLIVPHTVRLALGPEHRMLLPAAVLAGAIFLVGGDLLARLVVAPGEIPVGIVTAICGGPFFAYLLWSRRGDI